MIRPTSLLAYGWAAPASALGLVLLALAAVGGLRVDARAGVLEASGPGVRGVLRALNPFLRIAAITLGHVVLACDEQELARTRAHERVHVAQYARWGVALIPAYLAASLWALCRGRDPYRDNPFERAASAVDAAATGAPVVPSALTAATDAGMPSPAAASASARRRLPARSRSSAACRLW